jgi:hypothetical protein|tara:strand:+ start:34 stop:1299 length:1266 start_codon:yes stop_codon:yes gene_type:complete
MGLFDNFKKRNKARKERNIRRETLRRAASGDQSDYVKKQMKKYGTSLEDFKANPDEVGTGILAGSPGFTNTGPRTADQFIDQQNRISQLQKELRGIVDQKSSLTSQPSTMGLTNAYQDAIRQFKDRGDLAQQAFRQELPNPLIKAAQGIGSFIRGGGLLGVLMRALDGQDKQVNVANQSFRSPQDMESLTDPDGAGIETSDTAGFRYNSETGRFERVPGAQVMDGETIQKAAEARQMAAARQAGAENMYNQMYGQPISMPLGPSFPNDAGIASGTGGINRMMPSMIPDGQTLQKQAEARQIANIQAQNRYNQMFGQPIDMSGRGPSFPNDAGIASGTQGISPPPNLYPDEKFGTPLVRRDVGFFENLPFYSGPLDFNFKPEGPMFVPQQPIPYNMGGNVMNERTMDPTYAKLKVFNDTAYE